MLFDMKAIERFAVSKFAVILANNLALDGMACHSLLET